MFDGFEDRVPTERVELTLPPFGTVTVRGVSWTVGPVGDIVEERVTVPVKPAWLLI